MNLFKAMIVGVIECEFQNKKFVVLAEYFEQQTNCSRYRRKLSQSRRSPSSRNQSIYLSSSNKWKPCHGAINSRPRNLRMALEKYFRFQWNCKQLRVEARNSMANSGIYFPIFSETIQFWKYFHSMILGRLGKGYCKKIGCSNFWPKFLARLLQHLLSFPWVLWFFKKYPWVF